MNAFGFQRQEEALRDGVIPHITGATHAAGHANFAEQSLKVFARVLRPTIGVVDQRRRAAAPPHGHHERIGD